MGKLQATLISNAGILLEYENTKILVDAIYDDEGHDFSGIPHKTWVNDAVWPRSVSEY